MSVWRIPAAPLTGGVSRQPQPNRDPTQTQTADNAMLLIHRGLEKRFGTEYVQGPDVSTGLLNYGGTASANAHYFWIDRSSTERFLVIVDDDQTDNNIVQVFDYLGDKRTVNIDTTGGDPRDYLKITTGTVSKDKLGSLVVGNASFIWNSTVTVAVTGSAPAYANLKAKTELKFPGDGYTGPGDYDTGDFIHLISGDIGYPIGFYEVIASVADAGDQKGPWYERVQPDTANNKLNATTMPVRLDYSPTTGEFTLRTVVWNTRLSGDDLTNPSPSFVGKSISSMSVFQDRLVIGAGTSLVFSQAGDIYNFWLDDYTNVVDSDPVDIALTGSSVHTVQHMETFNKTLVVFANGAKQYEVQFQNAFSPSTANLVETTSYRSSATQPAKMGNQLYFVSDHGDYGFLWEYFYNFDADSNIANNSSLHVEGYLPSDISRVVVSENSGIVLLYAPSEPYHLYAHFVYWDGVKKLQQAWCRWVYDSAFTILSYTTFGEDLYLLFKDAFGIHLEKQPLSVPEAESGLNYSLLMDRKATLSGTYSSSTGLTTFALPFKDAAIDEVILGGAWGTRKGQRMAATNDSAGSTTNLTISGNFSAQPVWVGKNYDFSVELTKPYPKDQSGQVIAGNYQIRYIDMLLRDTATLDISVEPYRRSSRTSRYSAARVGEAILGAVSVAETDRFRAPIRGDASSTTITISNSTPLPCQITNMEIVGTLVARRNNPTK